MTEKSHLPSSWVSLGQVCSVLNCRYLQAAQLIMDWWCAKPGSDFWRCGYIFGRRKPRNFGISFKRCAE